MTRQFITHNKKRFPLRRRYFHDYRKSHEKQLQMYGMDYRKKHRKELNESIMRRYKKLREDAINHYSRGKNTCNCSGCGEKKIKNLVVEHIDGKYALGHDGLSNVDIYLDLKKKGYPKGVQVMCKKCNGSKRDRGECQFHGGKLIIPITKLK